MSGQDGNHILQTIIDNEDGDYEEDQVMMDAMDCGADDFEADDDVFTVYTTPDDFNAVADALTAKKYSFVFTKKDLSTKVPESSTGVRYARLPSLMQR